MPAQSRISTQTADAGYKYAVRCVAPGQTRRTAQDCARGTAAAAAARTRQENILRAYCPYFGRPRLCAKSRTAGGKRRLLRVVRTTRDATLARGAPEGRRSATQIIIEKLWAQKLTGM